MTIPKLDSFGTHRDCTDEEAKVIKHVVTAVNAGDQEIADPDAPKDDYGFLAGTDVDHAALWTSQGHFGIVESQVEMAELKMTQAIIILARVKQIDHAGFIEVCTARALGQMIDISEHDISDSASAARAVAHVLNNLAPDEATSLAGGTDVTDRAMTRAKNAAITTGKNIFQGHLASKISMWEESNDRSRFSHGVRYMNRAEREVEVTRRDGLTLSQRKTLESEVGHMNGPAVGKAPTAAAAKAILGNGS
jgi:hypothetical protein